MNVYGCLRSRGLTIVLSFLVSALGTTFTLAQDTSPAGPDAETSLKVEEEGTLTFSFRNTPWEDVLYWIADECDLSFTLDYTVPGSLNFVDNDRTYTPDEALDEINGQLLARGYTLVRRHKTLYIVDLESDVDKKFISDMLNEIPIEELSKRGHYELCKVRFQLKSISTEDAQKQVEQFVGPHGLIITVPLARQLVISETGENLRRIQTTLNEVESRVGSEGLRNFRLRYAKGDDVLMVAKQLLGIEQDESATEDGTIRISTDAKGTVVYATGAPEKIALVGQIVDQMERDAAAQGVTADLQLVSHRVHREDPEIVLPILETMFSGDPRIRLQARPDSILVYATADQHRLIQMTIAEVEQEPSRIEVIPLRRNDPLVAVALIERMFGVEVGEENANAPIVDAMFDPDKLVIKGNAAQIDQIRGLLSDMGEQIAADGTVAGPVIRVLPIDRDTLPLAIERLRQWPGIGNRIRIINRPQAPLIRVMPREEDNQEEDNQDGATPSTSGANETTSTSLSRALYVSKPVSEELGESPENGSDRRAPSQRSLVQTQAQAETQSTPRPEIILSTTPEGLVIISEDAAAVDALENLLFGIGGVGGGSKYNVFHLKHVEVEETKTLLETLFSSGATDASGSSSSTRGGVMGLLGGSATSIGAPTMIADKRLNRLFVEGTSTQIRDVEQYLKVIDVEDGPVDVQTNPKPTYIPVYFTTAESIVEVLKELYADRLYDPNARNRQQSGRTGGFGGFGGRGGFGGFGGRGGGGAETATTTGQPAKMTIAAEPSSNVVIVSAPGPLVREVRDVVRELDARAKTAPSEDYAVGQLSAGLTSETMKLLLKGSYGDVIQTDGDGIAAATTNNSSRRGNTAATPEAQAQQRRAAFFDAVRRGSGGGPGGGFRGFGFGSGRGGAQFAPGGGGVGGRGQQGGGGDRGGGGRGGGR